MRRDQLPRAAELRRITPGMSTDNEDRTSRPIATGAPGPAEPRRADHAARASSRTVRQRIVAMKLVRESTVTTCLALPVAACGSGSGSPSQGGAGGTSDPGTGGTTATTTGGDATSAGGAGAGGSENAGGGPGGGTGGSPPTEPEPPVNEPVLVISSQDAYWQEGTVTEVTSGTADVTVNDDSTAQDWAGFGGTFNEKGWEALSALGAEDRDSAIKPSCPTRRTAQIHRWWGPDRGERLCHGPPHAQ